MIRVTRSSAKTGDDAARARMRAGSGPSAVRSSSYLDVVESHPEWLGAPFIEEAECLRDTNETAWRWGGHLGEITGTGGAVFDNVHDARLSDSRIRGFERIDFRKNVLGRHEGGPQSLSFAKGSLPVTCTYRRPRLPAICASAHRQDALADFTRPIAAGPLRPKSLMGRTRKCEHQKIPHLKRHRAHARRTLAVQALNRFAVMQEAGRWATRTRKAHGRYRRSNA